MKQKVFEYVVVWHPTEKQMSEEGFESKIILAPTVVVCKDQEIVRMKAVRAIDDPYAKKLEQCEVLIRPFV